MKTLCTALASGALAVMLWIAVDTQIDQATAADTVTAGETKTMLAHMVYFTLNESSPAARQKLMDECDKYLADHPGTVHYSCGTVANLDREVNVRDFDVSLHLVFESRAAHDAYQVAPAHLKFIEENKASWKQVRVFDADIR